MFFLALPLVQAAFGLSLSETKILLVPVGDIEREVLDVLHKELAKAFEAVVIRSSPIALPREAFNSARGQYSSSFLLNTLRSRRGLGGQEKVLAIADVDLYASGLNFVFGEAEFGGRCAVISLTRLRQGFYALPENRDLFIERAKKEAVHELGHVFGLEHCPDRFCVMHFSNSLPDTDTKKSAFCPPCQARLGKLMK